MGVNSVNGQDTVARLAERSATAPAPPLRTAQAAETRPQETQREPEPSEEQVQRSAETTGEASPAFSRNLPRLRVDEESKEVIIQIVNENNEVVKQIPPEELVKLSEKFEKLQGLLFNRTT